MSKLLPALIVLISIALISIVSRFHSATPPSLGAATAFGPWNLARGALSGDPAFFEAVGNLSVQRVGLWQDPTLAALLAVHVLFVLWVLRKA